MSDLTHFIAQRQPSWDVGSAIRRRSNSGDVELVMLPAPTSAELNLDPLSARAVIIFFVAANALTRVYLGAAAKVGGIIADTATPIRPRCFIYQT